jgi:hypothetical protein
VIWLWQFLFMTMQSCRKLSNVFGWNLAITWVLWGGNDRVVLNKVAGFLSPFLSTRRSTVTVQRQSPAMADAHATIHAAAAQARRIRLCAGRLLLPHTYSWSTWPQYILVKYILILTLMIVSPTCLVGISLIGFENVSDDKDNTTNVCNQSATNRAILCKSPG